MYREFELGYSVGVPHIIIHWLQQWLRCTAISYGWNPYTGTGYCLGFNSLDFPFASCWKLMIATIFLGLQEHCSTHTRATPWLSIPSYPSVKHHHVPALYRLSQPIHLSPPLHKPVQGTKNPHGHTYKSTTWRLTHISHLICLRWHHGVPKGLMNQRGSDMCSAH